MAYFTYDTSVLISRRLTDFHEMPQQFLMSAIVQMELIAGAQDESRRKSYERAFRQCQKDNSLIVPTDDDWLLASKILYQLTNARKRSQKGKLQRLPPESTSRD